MQRLCISHTKFNKIIPVCSSLNGQNSRIHIRLYQIDIDIVSRTKCHYVNRITVC